MKSIGALVFADVRRGDHPAMPDKERKKDATLSDENVQESVRLKALWDKSTHGLTQKAFGKEFDIGNQGMVWQCLNGKIAPISLKAAMGFARGLGVDIADFSPRLAELAAKSAQFAPKRPAVPDLIDLTSLSKDEAQIIMLFRGLKHDHQHELMSHANTLYARDNPEKSKANPFSSAPLPGGGGPKPVSGRSKKAA